MPALSVKFAKRALFPTNIFQIDLPQPEVMNAGLLSAIYAEKAKDEAGLERSNNPALGGWHSHNDLHHSAEFRDITKLIDVMGAQISQDQGFHDHFRLRISMMWSIINPPGSSNRAHVHPGSMFSGVYYIQAAEGAGDIEFTDPRIGQVMHQPIYQSDAKRAKESWPMVKFTPTPGRMLIFPSWLYHSVAPNLAKAEGDAANRVIISFNLNQIETPKGGKEQHPLTH
jgi:uncharacterized protein (TIGR02466 family)